MGHAYYCMPSVLNVFYFFIFRPKCTQRTMSTQTIYIFKLMSKKMIIILLLRSLLISGPLKMSSYFNLRPLVMLAKVQNIQNPELF